MKRALRNLVVSCSRCEDTTKADDCAGWAVSFDQGLPVAYICPSCQTTDEYVEAETNDAVVDYSSFRVGPDGRFSSKGVES